MKQNLAFLSCALFVVACGSSGSGAGAGGAAGSSAGGTGTGGATGGTGGTAGASGGTGGVGGTGGSSGSGGIGGSSGTGGVPSGCTEIHLKTLSFDASTSNSVAAQFRAELATTLGDAASVDGMTLSVTSLDGSALDETGSFTLGSGIESNYSTCEHCVVVVQDATSTTTKKRFFQESGTMTISASTPPSSAATLGLNGSLDQVKLIEVTIGGSPDYVSTPVPGGACLYFSSEPLNAAP